MTGIAIDPKLVEFSPNAQQAISQIGQPQTTGGVSVNQENVVPIAESAKQAPRVEAPSGFVQGLGDPLYGAAQLIAKGLESVPADYTFMGRPVAASAKRFVEQVVPQRESDYQIARAAAGEEGIDWPRMGGNVVTGFAPGGFIAKGAGLVAKGMPLAQAALTGGTSAALMTPVESSEDFWKNKLQQTMLGAGVGAGIDKTLGAVVSPAMTAAGQKLKELGVQLTPGEAFGGIVKSAEDLLAKLPIVGATARGAQERSLQAFNTGVINKALSNVGEKLPEGTTGREAIDYLYKASDKAYEDVLPKVKLGGTLDLYQGLSNTLGNFSTAEPKYAKYLNDFVSKRIIDPLSKGDIPGRAFKDIDIKLGEDIKAYAQQGGDGQKLANALKDIQGYMRQGLRATNPDDAPALDAANKLFADRVRIEKAAGYLGANEGVFTPSQLLSATKATDTSARDQLFSRGQARMQDVAQAGVTAMGAGRGVTPNLASSTAELGAGGAAIGSAMSGALPLTAALPVIPAVAGYTKPGIAAFNALMTSGRPAFAQDLRKELPAMLTPSVTGGLLRDPDYAARFDFRGMQNK